MDLGLRNRRALVLASSDGLGRAIATELAREEAIVVVCSRSKDRAEDAALSIRSETNNVAYAFEVDVADPAALERLFSGSIEALGGLDMLVCNAGGPPPGGFEALSEEAWRFGFELTLMSVARSIGLALPHFKNSGGGTILVLGSSSIKQPIPNLLLSNVFRPAVQALVKHLANELAKDGVRINMLSPGRILTKRTQELDVARAEREGKTIMEMQSDSVSRIPLGRLGEPQEFAKVAAFLLSSAAAYMTGSSVLVDGGMVRCL